MRLNRNSREQCLITAIAANLRRQTLNRWRLEHCSERYIRTEFALDFEQHAGRAERMTAQREELVPYSNWPDIQDFLPDGLQAAFNVVARRNEFKLRVPRPGIVREQCNPIDLSARRGRHLFHVCNPGGDHVIGNSLSQKFSQLLDAGTLLCARLYPCHQQGVS